MEINTEKLLTLSKYGKISILPHDNADVDAILSSVLLSKLLSFLNIPNEILVFDKKISKDTLHILDLLGVDISEYMVKEESNKRNIFLLDHHYTIHEGKVIGAFDHHPNSKNINYFIYENINTCATACIVYEYMKKFSMPVDKHIIKILAYAMLVDTTGFLSGKTVEKEALMLPKLLEEYDLDFEKIRDDSCLYTDIQNMNIDEIITNGLKTYYFKKGKVKASYIQLKDYEKDFTEDMYENITSRIQKYVIDEEIIIWVYIIYDLKEKKTYVEYIYSHFIISETHDKILSRGNDIMPKIENMCD